MATLEGFDFEFVQKDNNQKVRFSAYLPIDVARGLNTALGRITTIQDVTTNRVTQSRQDVTTIT